jgi:hypothetical protein
MKTFRVLTIAVALLSAAVAQAQSPRGFSVVLLLGEAQSSAAGDGMPPAPGLRKALNDVKDFLPYKSYRVLDTQWLRAGSTRMKGPDEQEYDVNLAVDNMPLVPGFNEKAGMLQVFFRLNEVGAAENSSEEFGRSIQAAELEKQRASLQAQMPSAQGAMTQEMKARLERIEKQIRMVRAHKLIDSKFQMEVGETVVVGTSKIGGDKGLVVLLTSVAGGK